MGLEPWTLELRVRSANRKTILALMTVVTSVALPFWQID